MPSMCVCVLVLLCIRACACAGARTDVCVRLECAAYITPRPGVAPEARDGSLAKAGPDGRTFNPRRVLLSPVTRTLTYHEPESDETLVRARCCSDDNPSLQLCVRLLPSVP